MSERSAMTRHWLTMVFVSLAAVIIPVLIYTVFVYRSQFQYQVARSERAVTEIEGEISARLNQMVPLLQRTPYASIAPKLQRLHSILEKEPTPAEPCGAYKPDNKTGASGTPDAPLISAAECPDLATVESGFSSACKPSKGRRELTEDQWKVLDEKWEQLQKVGESCAISLHQAAVKDGSLPKYMDALRQSPGFDRLVLNFGKTGGCQNLAGGDSGYRNILIAGAETKLRVADCAHTFLDSDKGRLSAEYAELPLRDVIKIAEGDQSFDGLWLFDGSGDVYFSDGSGAAAGLSSIDLPSLLERDPAKPDSAQSDSSHSKKPVSATLPAFREGVEIGGVDYQVFLQRVSIPIMDGDGVEKPLFLGAAISAAKFRSTVMQVRVTVLATMLAALVLAVCMLPYLRIMFIGPLEEIRTIDLLGLMMGVVTATGVFVIATLSILSYRTERVRLYQSTVQTADSMRTAFAAELKDSISTLAKRRDELRADLGPAETAPIAPCRIEDRNFEFAMMLDAEGQFLHTDSCRSSRVVPKKIPDRFYFRRIADGQWWDFKEKDKTEHFYLEPIRALDHGNRNTVLSMAVTTETGQPESKAIVAAMGRQLQVFSQQLLPPDVGFAVVEDESGRVLYHSSESRGLVENFYEETGEAQRLRIAVDARRPYDGAFIYRGMHVVGTSRPLDHVPWTLVVFADKNLAAAACFGAGVDAIVLFAVYGILLLIALFITRLALSDRPWAWAWPEAKRGYVQSFACAVLLLIAVVELYVGLGAAPIATPVIVCASAVLVLSTLFARMDPHRQRYFNRHRFNRYALACAAIAFLFAAWQWGAPRHVFATIVGIALVLWWGLVRPAEERSWSYSIESRCYPYAACASIMALTLGGPPAVLFFRDAWQQSAGRLALARAEQVAHKSRELDRSLAHESRRVCGAAGVVDCSAAVVPANAWRTRTEGLSDGRPTLIATVADPIAMTGRPQGSLCTVSDDAAQTLTKWQSRSLEGYIAQHFGFFPLAFSQPTARLSCEAAGGDRKPAEWGWSNWRDNRFGWCLPNHDKTFVYAAMSGTAYLWNWIHYDGGAVSVAAIILLILGATLIGAMEPLIRRVFVLNLIPPMELAWDAIDMGQTRRAILVDPHEEQLKKLKARVSENWFSVHAAELLDDAKAAKVRDRLNVAPSSRAVLEPFMIRDMELLLVDPVARPRLLDILEEACRAEARVIALVTDVPPYEWLASQRVDGEVRNGSSSKDGSATSTGISPSELLRWSSLLQTFEIKNYRRPECSGSREEKPKEKLRPKKSGEDASSEQEVEEEIFIPAPPATEAETRLNEWCGWAQELEPIRALLARRPSLTVAQLDRELAFRAEPFYRKQWMLCTTAERLALLHLAEGKLPNPRNLDALQSLWRKGMIRKSPELEIVSSNFAGFVRTAETPEQLALLRSETKGGRWSVIRTPLLLTLATVIAFVAYVSRDALDNTVAVLGAVMTAVPLVTRVIGLARASDDVKVA